MLALRVILMAGVLFVVTGCGAAVVAALDNAMPVGMKSDCSISRVLRSEPLCKADGDPPPKEDLYCYRTEDPYGSKGADTQSKRTKS